MGKKLTQEEFIEKAKLKHGDKYDYSMVEYINWNTKIIIICKEHGEFLQVPNNHLNGRGCFYCSYDNKRGNKIDFVKYFESLGAKIFYENDWVDGGCLEIAITNGYLDLVKYFYRFHV